MKYTLRAEQSQEETDLKNEKDSVFFTLLTEIHYF